MNGKPVKAVAQVSKVGFLYVFDRVTGESRCGLWKSGPYRRVRWTANRAAAYATVSHLAAAVRDAGFGGRPPHRLHAGTP